MISAGGETNRYPAGHAGHVPAHLRPPRRQQHEPAPATCSTRSSSSCAPPPRSSPARRRGSRSTRRRRCAASRRSTISGSLRFPDGSSADGVALALEYLPAVAGAAWRSVATAVAAVDGSWRATVELRGSGSLRAVFAGDAARAPLASPPRKITVLARLNLTLNRNRLRLGSRVRVARDGRPGDPRAAHARRPQPAPLGARAHAAWCACAAAPTTPACARAGAASTA